MNECVKIVNFTEKNLFLQIVFSIAEIN